MKGSSGFDTYRILIPGAVVLVLVDVAARLLGSLDPASTGFWELIPLYADEVRSTVEDPFAALIMAFALGLLLYWLDPAYAAPEYQRYLPSEYLNQKLKEKGIDSRRVALSVYMYALNELVSDSLNDRTILMGAMYRIGFDTVFATFVIGSLMALGSALTLGNASVDLDPQALADSSGWFVSAVLATGILTWRTRPKGDSEKREKDGDSEDHEEEGDSEDREEDHEKERRAEDHEEGSSTEPSKVLPDVARGVLMVLAGLVGILLFAQVESAFWSPAFLVISYTFIVGVWVVLRLRGPQWRDWIGTIRQRGTRTFVPNQQFALWQLALIDGTLVVSISLLLAALGAHMRPIQLAVPNALLLTALLLAYLRKYERQLHAVYWNQHTWIDLHIDLLLGFAQTLVASEADSASLRDTRSSPSDEEE